MTTIKKKFPVIECPYDPARLDWDCAINQALKDRGLNRGKATVIAMPVIYEGVFIRVIHARGQKQSQMHRFIP